MTWSDHTHSEYAGGRHDHDLDYAEKHHRHYDDERAVEDLRGQIRELRAIMIEFGLDLSEAQGRIRALEDQTPEARRAGYEADIAWSTPPTLAAPQRRTEARAAGPTGSSCTRK